MFGLFKFSNFAQQSFKFNLINRLNVRKAFSSFQENSDNYFRGRYTPLMPLNFINARCKIYDYSIYDSVSKGYYIILGLGGLLSLYFINKLINFKERKWYGLIFYGMAALYITPKVYHLARIYSGIIHQIHLEKGGNNIFIKHAQYGLIPTETKFDISHIQRPMEPDLAIQIFRFAYPVLIDNQLFYLPRDTDFQNEEVMPPIMNGIYINTESEGNYTDEIIIE